jgi:exopolyphosphatase/guanosine-5'-triphosphate,3'-diphosphate pyrophosphatase
MRFAVLDIGGHSTFLRVVDLVPGLPPQHVASFKQPVRLAGATDDRGAITEEGIGQLVTAVGKAVSAATAHRVDALFPYATAAVRCAANRDRVLHRVRAACGVDLATMSGVEEARLTFLAARRWYGWSAGPLLLLDVGGGSMEIAHGPGERPSYAVSLPLGAGLLTRTHLPLDSRYGKSDVRALRHHVRSVLAGPGAALRQRDTPELRVATSRTFTQLARLTGAPKTMAGPYRARTLERAALRRWIPRLAGLTAAERAELPGVSRTRSRQILAGAVVAEAAMDCLRIDRLAVCPWALREGIFLETLDRVTAAESATESAADVPAEQRSVLVRARSRTGPTAPVAIAPPATSRQSRSRMSGV